MPCSQEKQSYLPPIKCLKEWHPKVYDPSNIGIINKIILPTPTPSYQPLKNAKKAS